MSRRNTDKNLAILKALLREDGNNNCADCKTATHPRWASWNLGIFICIRCSGIHRSMGTHISRVKSVDLDTWTDEQAASMVKWGNNRANQYWEAKLPGGKHIPDDSKIENFIRTKYDLKKWASSQTIPNPESIKATQTQSPIQHQQSYQSSKQTGKSSNLLDLEFGSPISAPTKSPSLPHTNQLPNQKIGQAYDQQSHQHQNQSQHEHRNHQQHAQQHFQSPPPQPQRDNSRPELKKSILSLYSTPLAAANSTPNFPLQSHNQVQPQQNLNFNSSTPAFSQPQQSSLQNNWSSTSSSINSLQFNNNNSNNQTPNNLSNENWNSSNPWSNVESKSSIKQDLSVNDPFKNIWK